MLGQLSMLQDGSLMDKVEIAVKRLKSFEPPEGYFLAFSGGKDSQCVYHLCKRAGVKFDAHYSVTSVDPPELMRFIRNHYPDVIWDYPRDKDGNRITMWNLILKKKMPPTRLVRYCCEKLKEAAGEGRLTVTGVRWAESANRKNNRRLVNIQGGKWQAEEGAQFETDKFGGAVLNDDNDAGRRMVEHCYRTNKTLLNPIVDWEDEDVWEYLRNIEKVAYCSLYDEGYKRLGCIGCPMNTRTAEIEFKRWPRYKELYLKAFGKMLEERKKAGKEAYGWKTADDVMRWWLGQ